MSKSLAIVLGTLSLSSVALAAPSIAVSKVSNTPTRMTLKVTGSGFTKNRAHQIEIDSNFAFSGNDQQFVSATADSAGKISVQFTKDLNASCAVGVSATDAASGAESNGITLSYASSCVPPHIDRITLLGRTSDLSAAVEYHGVGYTPNGSVSITTTDVNNGVTYYSDQFVNPDGTFGGHSGFPYPASCGHTVRVTTYDDYTDTPATNAPTIVLCKN